ncbi:MAG TPA: hypothetical protein VKJ65_14775 [Phycisphaerae bacterium]|nr:hypothetical protein [Phycisphaerae bacterium]
MKKSQVLKVSMLVAAFLTAVGCHGGESTYLTAVNGVKADSAVITSGQTSDLSTISAVSLDGSMSPKAKL